MILALMRWLCWLKVRTLSANSLNMSEAAQLAALAAGRAAGRGSATAGASNEELRKSAAEAAATW